MPLNDILNTDIIDLNVEGNTKDEVLRYMANVLLKNGYINDRKGEAGCSCCV